MFALKRGLREKNKHIYFIQNWATTCNNTYVHTYVYVCTNIIMVFWKSLWQHLVQTLKLGNEKYVMRAMWGTRVKRMCEFVGDFIVFTFAYLPTTGMHTYTHTHIRARFCHWKWFLNLVMRNCRNGVKLIDLLIKKNMLGKKANISDMNWGHVWMFTLEIGTCKLHLRTHTYTYPHIMQFPVSTHGVGCQGTRINELARWWMTAKKIV